MKASIKVDLPYPDLSSLDSDLYSARLIAPCYAGQRGEITAILQYVYHGYFLGDNERLLNVMNGIALCEMEHLKMLGIALKKLGCDPLFTNLPPFRFNPYSTTAINYSKDVHKMLLDDISAETSAVFEYERILSKLSNEKVGALISRIILDERLHVNVLKAELENISKHTF